MANSKNKPELRSGFELKTRESSECPKDMPKKNSGFAKFSNSDQLVRHARSLHRQNASLYR